MFSKFISVLIADRSGAHKSFILFNKNNEYSPDIEEIFAKIVRMANLIGLPRRATMFFCAKSLFDYWGPEESYLFLRYGIFLF